MTKTDGDTLAGFGLALAAYLIWGALPLYLHLANHIPLPEVLAHRVLWSVPIALAVLIVRRRTDDLRRALTSARMLAMASVTATLISINWGVYLYSIQTGQVLDSALGYYINPLFSIFLGAVILGEKLTPLRWAAVGLAFIAVLVLTLEAGRLPLISITLMVSWGLYALAKRALPIGPNQGFTLEVLLLTPLAAGWIAWQAVNGTLVFGRTGAWDMAILMGCGVVTAVPLMLYANGAKQLRLTTIALMQYIVPTFVMLIAVLAFGEPFEGAKFVAFPLIWAGLALYSADLFRHRRAALQ